MGWLVCVCAHSPVTVLKQAYQDSNCLLLSLANVLSRLMWGQGALDATCSTTPHPQPVQPFPLAKEDSRHDIGTHWCGLCLGPWSSFQPHIPRDPCVNSPISYPPGSISSLELAICRKPFQQPRAAARSSHSSSGSSSSSRSSTLQIGSLAL